MPISRPEPKPPWRSVPQSVKLAAESALDGRIVRAMRAWGGYGPTPTFRLRLADGRKAFLKGVSPESNEFSVAALARELQVYQQLASLIGGYSPAVRSAFQLDGWSVLLLEDLGPKTAPPWTRPLLRVAMHGLADFHRETSGLDLPPWLRRPKDWFVGRSRSWAWLTDAGSVERIAELAGFGVLR